MPAAKGTMVTEEVRLVEPLASSQSGNVWLADQLDWRKKVVVKFLAALESKGDEGLERFLASAAQAQELTSPHVCRIHDFGVSDDFTPFVVVEKLDGEPLDRKLRQNDHLDPTQVGEVVAQVAEVLTEAHAADLLHLGLAPETIFSTGEGSDTDVKVMDLGIACALPFDRQSAYVSPEQYLGRSPDEKADLWSLGAIAYFCLTGQHAIDGDKRRMMQWDVEPPSEMWLADVPPEVDAWFERALHKTPDKRFDSASAMAEAFADLIPGLEHLQGSEQAKQPLQAQQVVSVGESQAPEDEKSRDVVVQEATDDAPAIVIDVDD